MEMPDLRGGLGGAGDGDEPGLALHQQVVGLLVAVRPGGAVAGDVADDQARVPLPQGLCAEAEPPGRARREVLHEDVGPLDEAAQDLLGAVLLQIQRQGLLGAVEPDEVAGEAFHRPVVSAGEVPHFGALDLDHAGAEVGELAGGEWRGDRLLQGDDRDAFSGSIRRTSASRGRARRCTRG